MLRAAAKFDRADVDMSNEVSEDECTLMIKHTLLQGREEVKAKIIAELKAAQLKQWNEQRGIGTWHWCLFPLCRVLCLCFSALLFLLFGLPRTGHVISAPAPDRPAKSKRRGRDRG